MYFNSVWESNVKRRIKKPWNKKYIYVESPICEGDNFFQTIVITGDLWVLNYRFILMRELGDQYLFYLIYLKRDKEEDSRRFCDL